MAHKGLRVSVFQPVYQRAKGKFNVADALKVAAVVRCSECKSLTKTVNGVPPAKCSQCGKSEVLF
jgi:hypothetical protein